jgi:hypothetical protein
MEDKNSALDELLLSEDDEKSKKKKQYDFRPWIGFGLDGTTAFFGDYLGIEDIGHPIPPIIALIKEYLNNGVRVKIFTDRISHSDAEVNRRAEVIIKRWCLEHIGQELEVTNKIDFNTDCIYDTRVKEVITNTGVIVISNKE